MEVEGSKALRRQMRAAGKDMQDMKEANAAVGQIVVAASRPRAPVSTGNLAASIRANRAVGSATIKAGGARVPYAGPIHWGWPRRHIRAQPFLADGAKSSEPSWVATYEKAVDRILGKIKGDA
jgi:hypothetical protein